MELKINSKELQKAVGKVAAIINPASLMPVLSNVKISSHDGVMAFMGTDMQTVIMYSIKFDAEDFSFGTNAKILLDLLKSLPDEEVTIFIGEDFMLASSKGNFNIPIVESTEFPTMPAVVETDSFSMKGYILDTVLKPCLTTVSDDDMRPVMTGVCFDFKEDGVTFVSTNGFKLSQYKTKIKGNGGKIIVPPVVLSNVLGLQDEEVSMVYNDNNIIFDMMLKDAHIKVIGRLVDGNYPPYEKVVPENLSQSAVVESKDLIEAIKRALIFAPEDNREISIGIEGSCINVRADNFNYSRNAQQGVFAEIDGDPKVIKFSGNYLLDVLKNAGEGKIKISYGAESYAVLINNPASPGLTGLVMPLNT